MAKYEDYVTQDLEDEIDEAADAAKVRQETVDELPERFKGKTASEIARSYVELERLKSQHDQEVGDLRKTVKELLEMQTKSSEPAKPAPKPVTVDDLYDNADDSIRRVVREESQSRIDELERKLQEAEHRAQFASARAEFDRKHPEWQATLKDPTFIEWVKSSPYRLRQAQVADGGDWDAADELFSTYAEISEVKQQKPSKRDAVKKASLESSGGNAPTPTEKFSRSKLESLRVRARQGDPEAERYLTANGEEILLAYAEGRIVN